MPKKVYKSWGGLDYHLNKMREEIKTTFNWAICVFPKDTRIIFSNKMGKENMYWDKDTHIIMLNPIHFDTPNHWNLVNRFII